MGELVILDDIRAEITAHRVREALIAGPSVYGLRRGDRVTVHSTGRCHTIVDFIDGRAVVWVEGVKRVLQPNTYTVL